MKKWIVLSAEGEPTWWEQVNDLRFPLTYTSKKAAEQSMLEDFLDALNNQIREFKAGQREFDEMDLSCDEYVEECEYKDRYIILNNEKWLTNEDSNQ